MRRRIGAPRTPTNRLRNFTITSLTKPIATGPSIWPIPKTTVRMPIADAHCACGRLRLTNAVVAATTAKNALPKLRLPPMQQHRHRIGNERQHGPDGGDAGEEEQRRTIQMA